MELILKYGVCGGRIVIGYFNSARCTRLAQDVLQGKDNDETGTGR